MEVFLQYLERPDIAAAPTEEYLRTLLKRYPWFTTARLMLSRISGKVDPALSLYLATRPAPGLLLRSSGASGISPVVGTQGPPSDAVGPDVDEGAASVAGSVAMADASGMTGEAVTGSPTFEVIDRFWPVNAGGSFRAKGFRRGILRPARQSSTRSWLPKSWPRFIWLRGLTTAPERYMPN